MAIENEKSNGQVMAVCLPSEPVKSTVESNQTGNTHIEPKVQLPVDPKIQLPADLKVQLPADPPPHCNYLDIYISRKIRLCVVDLDGQFQTTLPVKDINLLIWKFRSIILIFLLFFAGNVKSTAFLHTVNAIPKNCNLTQKCDSDNSTFRNSINSVQKAVNLTTPAKNRRKMRIIDLNFQIKKMISLASKVLWNWPSKSTTQSLIFREM